MGFWATIMTILRLWPQVVAFVSFAKDVADKARIDAAIEQLREAFHEVESIEETAQSSSDINDSFRN